MIYFIISTNKGYICERTDNKTYTLKNNEFYAKSFNGAFFNTANSGCSDVDMLGFTSDKEKALKYCSCIGNRVQEIIDRIVMGYEPEIKEIKIEII